MNPTPTQELIEEECYFIRDLLLDKNRKYGDSAINPLRIFSSVDAIEQINVRIDDKLSRIASAQGDDTEDPELDLIGYLILKLVALRKNRIIAHQVERKQGRAAALMTPFIVTDPEDLDPEDISLDADAIDRHHRQAHALGVVADPGQRQRICDLGYLAAEKKGGVDGVNA